MIEGAHAIATENLISVTVHQLLLGDGDEVSGGDGVGALDRPGGGERPAGSTLALVLHGSHGVLAKKKNNNRVLHLHTRRGTFAYCYATGFFSPIFAKLKGI